MSNLVIVEHDNNEVALATLHAVTAAQQIGGDIDLLVAGENCASVAEAAAKIAGVAKVKVASRGKPGLSDCRPGRRLQPCAGICHHIW